ncbi:carbonic anhydrase 3-like [Planococcus citri]|uniref:carbonic anhydrase 3-like n=1 Tax=Planococcus citri TaxID=170843 RepID=UPI0031FA12DD
MYIPTILTIKLKFIMVTFLTATCLKPDNQHATPSPINIESSKVKSASTTTPVTLHNALFGFLNFTNNGKTLITYTNQLLDPSSITGSVLCNEITLLYKIHTIILYINQNPNGRSAHSVDGKGLPLELWVIYYKKSYGSLEKALKFPDGIIVLAFPVGVRKTPRTKFIPFQVFLSSGILNKPRSSSELFGLIGYVWFDNISIFGESRYYSYIGSYLDPETKKQSQSAKVILCDPEQAPMLSYEQFALFKNILGSDGKPINFTLPIYPQKSRTVYKGIGLQQKFIPIV